jgi:PAS domain S-box-containing protein
MRFAGRNTKEGKIISLACPPCQHPVMSVDHRPPHDPLENPDAAPDAAPDTTGAGPYACALPPVLLGALVASLPVGLAVIDRQGEFLVTNAALARILGIPADELDRHGWGPIFFDSETNLEFNQALVEAIDQEQARLVREVPYRRPDGGDRRLSVTTSFLRDTGQVAGIVVLVSDVTATWAAHEREKGVLQEMTVVQRRRAEGMNLFALSVAHQIRNPLSAMGGFAALALRRRIPECGCGRPLETILEEAGKLEGMVKAVEEYASLGRGTPRAVSLNRLLADMAAELGNVAHETGQHLDLKLGRTACMVHADPALLGSALREIGVNALQAAHPEPARVSVSAWMADHHVHLLISDQGPGIEPGNLPYIFDPFFTTAAHRVGMGLTKARRILADAHGSLEVSGEPGNGTRAALVLPCLAPEGRDAEPAP